MTVRDRRLHGVLISTCSGDLASLNAVTKADDFVREGALLALAYLAHPARAGEGEMRAYLRCLLAEMRPQAQGKRMRSDRRTAAALRV